MSAHLNHLRIERRGIQGGASTLCPGLSRVRATLRERNGAAFTLIEVMISIALVLILVLGINQVFKMAADTVGAGQALSSKIRDSRAAQSVFTKELAHVAPDGAFFMIDSRTIGAYRNAADQASDLDGNGRTIDLNGNNVEGEPSVPGEILGYAIANTRNHRVDTLSFFARDLYPRQTGNAGTYIANESSSEAMVTYGHLRVYDQTNSPDLDTSYPDVGTGSATTNPKGFYADDFVLGRVIMLLSTPSGTPPFPGSIYDRTTPTPVQQSFWAVNQTNTVADLAPLGKVTQAYEPVNPTSPIPTITDARYDLAGTSISDFRARLLAYMAAGFTYPQTDWWQYLGCSPVDLLIGGTTYFGRFRCDPYPPKPLDSRKVAQASSPLLANCTQFSVEFAGDYFTQGIW